MIPRGGANLIQTVVTESTVPVIETGIGVNHVYVDAAADLDVAERIVVNAKAQRPSVCNAAETLLVHESVAEAFLPKVLAGLGGAGVVRARRPRAGASRRRRPGRPTRSPPTRTTGPSGTAST